MIGKPIQNSDKMVFFSQGIILVYLCCEEVCWAGCLLAAGGCKRHHQQICKSKQAKGIGKQATQLPKESIAAGVAADSADKMQQHSSSGQCQCLNDLVFALLFLSGISSCEFRVVVLAIALLKRI